jgi:phenylpropionate dioxygenase-like ring-hydroxylating dioxygenase large terminal subunit
LQLEFARLLAVFLGDVVGKVRVLGHDWQFDAAGLCLSVRRERSTPAPRQVDRFI